MTKTARRTIDKFIGEYAFLSHSYRSPMTVDGIEYPTLSHALQATKTDDPDVKREIAQQAHPKQAKRIGRAVVNLNYPLWLKAEAEITAALLTIKFKEPTLKAKLLATGNSKIVSGKGDDSGRLLTLPRDFIRHQQD